MARFNVLMAVSILIATVAGQARAGVAEVTQSTAKVEHKSFNPKRPPAAMPKLTPPETAVCEGIFPINVTVSAQARPTSTTTADMAVTQVTVKLDCHIVVWTPKGVEQHVMDHEDGHRTINETFYKKAAEVAHAVADEYVGKQITLSGANLKGQFNDKVDQISKEIADAYKKKLDVEKTQAAYDRITEHSLNDVAVPDAIKQAFAETNPDVVKQPSAETQPDATK